MKKILIAIVLILSPCLISMGQPKETISYSNPILIGGTSFGNFFKALYKTGDFDSMMKFTSSRSIERYGYNNVLEYYKSIDFGYAMKLRSRTIVNGVYSLNYAATILGTEKVVRINVIVENDSSKIVLDNIMFNLGIDYQNVMGDNKKVYDIHGNVIR